MSVGVTFSIKGVPDELADALREQARLNHRSIQGELMAILEQNLRARPFRAHTLLSRVRALGLETPPDSTAIVREARNSR